MDELARTVAEVVERHPAPAVPLEELGVLVARERPEAVPSLEALLDLLRENPGRLRLLEGDRERLGAGGPSCWIVAVRDSRSGAPPGSIVARLRECLCTLGASLEPGSHPALARWARLLREETRVRAIIAPATPPRKRSRRRKEDPTH